MNKELVVNQTGVLLSMLTPLALRNIAFGILDMIDDAADISEFMADPKVVEPIKTSIRMACDNDT